jgi:hypothetical protein
LKKRELHGGNDLKQPCSCARYWCDGSHTRYNYVYAIIQFVCQSTDPLLVMRSLIPNPCELLHKNTLTFVIFSI